MAESSGQFEHPKRLDRRLSVAPMMDWTDRHDRRFLRLCAPHTLLYTEMVTAGAIVYGDIERHLRFNAEEHPVAVQFGGSEPEQLAVCARAAEAYGYDEVNLNVGCPSDRVQAGRFGACLMAEPRLVADCVAAMREATRLPVTVKSRIGIDDRDSYEHLLQFVEQVSDAGCRTFIVHARKAWLQGLSPKQNREIPPLDYPRVYRLKQDFPELEIIINGGIRQLSEISEHIKSVDGVMIGREAYANPWALAQWDAALWNVRVPRTRHQVIRDFMPYIEQELLAGTKLSNITRHILGLFQGVPGAKAWRRHLSENAWRVGRESKS
ncbi:tRNA dihydrouridine(20/20a) synthase DusA [Alkalilimnicola ehrlichii]|uniref:tRNA dihydrouridine(20/20a) synthase DusA n=1 Tax=Alkalilimnicola ehrlichii TaxID=351052 RepID=UPI002868A4B3|nr:tRNA dihydrouridine(20/20a) synthase DusA [Alkalilimnicola ehrlichii]